MTGVTRQHGEKSRVLARDPHGHGVTYEPDQTASDPQPETQTDGSGERAVEDGEAARCAGKQDRFGQGAVQHHVYHEECTWFPEIREAVPASQDAMLTRRFREEFDRYMGGAEARTERPLQMAAEMDDSGARQSESDGPLDY